MVSVNRLLMDLSILIFFQLGFWLGVHADGGGKLSVILHLLKVVI